MADGLDGTSAVGAGLTDGQCCTVVGEVGVTGCGAEAAGMMSRAGAVGRVWFGWLDGVVSMSL